jgi:4-hydroxy-4-methyl-2-oxoglutarate aldolase
MLCYFELKGFNIDPFIRPIDINNAKILGTAFTVTAFEECEESSIDVESKIETIFSKVGQYDVICVAANCSSYGAIVNARATAAAKEKGAGGIVIDGAARNILRIKSIGSPCFIRHAVPSGANMRMQIGSLGRAIRLGGVIIKPGDVIAADCDGIVVISAKKAVDVIERSIKRSVNIKEAREAIKNGATLIQAWKQYGVI